MIRRIGIFIAAIFAGIALMFLVQLSVTRVWWLMEVTWGPDNLPLQGLQQFAALLTSLLAVASGAALITWIAKQDARRVLILFGLIGVVFDGYIMFVKIEGLPVWFRVAFVMVVPIAVVFGWYSANCLLGSKRARRVT